MCSKVILWWAALVQLSHGFELRVKSNKSNKERSCSLQESLLSDNYAIWKIEVNNSKLNPNQTNFAWLERFDECIHTRRATEKFKGKYCLAQGTLITKESDPQPVSYLGVCVPKQYTTYEVQKAVSEAIPDTNFMAVICQTKSDLSQPLDTGAVATLYYLAVLVILIILSTMYDLSNHQGKFHHPLLISFSIYTNCKKLFNSKNPTGQFPCLQGIKVLSIWWILVGHQAFVTVAISPLTNRAQANQYFFTPESLFLANGVYSVDTFFVISGLLLVYNFTKNANNGQFNVFQFYFCRYLRLTPPVLSLLLVITYLSKYIGSGPLYPYFDLLLAKPCQEYWWSTLLYVGNYVNRSTCIPHTWFINVDWHLYLISPLFLLLLPTFSRYGLMIMGTGIAASMAMSFVVTWNNRLPVILFNNIDNLLVSDYLTMYYMTTHTRAAPWLIGGILGYFMGKFQGKKEKKVCLNIPKWAVTITWLTVIVGMTACIFVGPFSFSTDVYYPYFSAFYNAFTRPAWALGVGWIIFACSFGYDGGFLNSFLSLPLFQVMHKFTYSVYLLHVPLQFGLALNTKETSHFTIPNLVLLTWKSVVLSYAVAFFWVLAFESPILEVRRIFATKRNGKNKLV